MHNKKEIISLFLYHLSQCTYILTWLLNNYSDRDTTTALSYLVKILKFLHIHRFWYIVCILDLDSTQCLSLNMVKSIKIIDEITYSFQSVSQKCWSVAYIIHKMGVFNKISEWVVERSYEIVKSTLDLELHQLETMPFYLLDVRLQTSFSLSINIPIYKMEVIIINLQSKDKDEIRYCMENVKSWFPFLLCILMRWLILVRT